MDTQSYPVMETFYTIQGEGAFSGVPAYFIRLGGCDVGCVWCDVKESWDASIHPQKSVVELLNEVNATAARVVVITGGEPAMYNLEPLTTAFRYAGLRMHIETSGAHTLSGEWDWVTFSPKKFKAPLESIYNRANELKIIVFNASDFDWAEKFKIEMNASCMLYLQAEWDKREKIYPQIMSYITAHPEWRISVQTHKYLGVE